METKNKNSELKNFKKHYTGKMSSEEEVAFEKNLEEDPFAKEAYEGFLYLENDSARISLIEKKNLVLKEKFGFKNNRNIFPLKYAITFAASLAFFISSYIVIQNNLSTNNENLAENHIEELNIPEMIDSLAGSTFSNTLTGIKETTKPNKKKKTFETVGKAVQIEKSKKHNDTEFDNYKKRTRGKGVSSQIENKDNFKQSTNTAYTDDSEIVALENLKNPSEYKKGIVTYNKSEFTKAIKHFNNSLIQNNKISGSYYYIAMSYFNQNQSLNAIKYFDKTIDIDLDFKDNALWYKSLALLNSGKKIEAEVILTQISISNSTYKNVAIKKLATLN